MPRLAAGFIKDLYRLQDAQTIQKALSTNLLGQGVQSTVLSRLGV
jgi:hypothetical protein